MSIMADEVGTYDLVVRDVSNGCQAVDRVMVLIDTATAAITLMPGDTIDCNTTTSGVTATLTEPVTDYDLTWSTVDGTITGPVNGTSINVSQGGTYTLVIVNKDNGCSRSASADVAESDEIIDAVDVQQQNVVCFGQNDGSLSAISVTGGSPPYTYAWSTGVTGVTTLSGLRPGNYSLTVSDQNGCTWTDTYTITEPPLITVDVGRDTTVRNEDTVTLSIVTNLSANAIGSIEWSDYDGRPMPGNLTITFVATRTATMTATVTDTSGCTGADSMRLTVIVPRIIFIPTVFSPNGDGLNDYFTISGRRNLVNIALLKIYDRWGNQLFEKKDLEPGNESQGWDGRFRGEPMQPGVYVYAAELTYDDGVTEVVTGDITVLR
jgi:gliding motility-associated-like protein